MSDHRSPWRLLPIAAAIVLALVLLVGGGVWLLTSSATSGAAAAPPGVHLGGPATEDERYVAEQLVKEAPPGVKYEWIEFGPDDTEGLTHFKDPARYRVIRVAGWRAPAHPTPNNQAKGYFDDLYAVGPDAPVDPGHSGLWQLNVGDAGRDWLQTYIQVKKNIEASARHGH